ncbi:acyl-CoA N-acyltransferase [Xylariaceae sp. AK1471]|nr:acyl-CoA N-acyltransferase [Xylariaceae sp. AK1471]
MPVTIEPADDKDLPVLAEINRRTFLQELPSNFAYKPSADDGHLVDFFLDRLTGRRDQPHTQLFKAVDQDTKKIYGFACWTRVKVRDNKPASAPVVKKTPQLPPYINAEFVIATGAEVKQLEDHMKGEEHYYLTAFAVDLDHQNKGIGSQLLKHCTQIADEAELPTWLVAFPQSHSLFLRHGFVDVDHRDTDLNAWDNNRFRGYGIYRAYAMVRRS